MNLTELKEQIFYSNLTFEEKALHVFRYQFWENLIYQAFCKRLNRTPETVHSMLQIPFLPISCYKQHSILTPSHSSFEVVFESSGTGSQIRSKHYVHDLNLYETSFIGGFRQFFGEPEQYCILGLLPSYLERPNSSLVYMVKHLIELSKHPKSGFFLSNTKQLFEVLNEMESLAQPTLLFGVTFALLDFARDYPMHLSATRVIETGGMKGRGEEMLKPELHAYLKQQFECQHIYSEYGMTELLSQAYSTNDDIFYTPSWMSVFIRDLNDPLDIQTTGKGGIQVADLANVHACSFIATDDLGEVLPTGGFRIHGRIDHSEMRGCSLLSLPF